MKLSKVTLLFLLCLCLNFSCLRCGNKYNNCNGQWFIAMRRAEPDLCSRTMTKWTRRYQIVEPAWWWCTPWMSQLEAPNNTTAPSPPSDLYLNKRCRLFAVFSLIFSFSFLLSLSFLFIRWNSCACFSYKLTAGQTVHHEHVIEFTCWRNDWRSVVNHAGGRRCLSCSTSGTTIILV